MARKTEQPTGARANPHRPHHEDSRAGGLNSPLTVPDYPAPGLLERGLDLLFPPTCVGCRRVGRWICAGCWPRIGWLPKHSCSRCTTASLLDPCAHCRGIETSLDGTRSVAVFDDIAREAVHALKYHGHHAIASTMGKVMAAHAQDLAGTLVTPISLHPRRRRERGYDQAAMLARVVARSLDIRCDEVLRRVRYTPQQVTLDGEARRRNVAGAFEARVELEGEQVILIDDVLTTGATMEAAAAALKAAGAERVVGLVFAHAVAGGSTEENLVP